MPSVLRSSAHAVPRRNWPCSALFGPTTPSHAVPDLPSKESSREPPKRLRAAVCSPRRAQPNRALPQHIGPKPAKPNPALSTLVRVAGKAEALRATVCDPCSALARPAMPCRTAPVHTPPGKVHQ